MFTEKEVKAAPLVSMLFWTCTKAGGEPPVELTPVPVRLAVCGLPIALSITLTDPVRVPRAVGEKTTLIVQLEETAREGPQLLYWAKSPAVAIPNMFSVAVPQLVSVTACGALVAPTATLPKLKLYVDKEGAGPLVVAAILTYCEPSGALSYTTKPAKTSPWDWGE